MARKIIIDTDPGQDDAVAILLALASPELEVLGLSIVAGNVPLHHTVRNALTLCELAGRPALAISPGTVYPLLARLAKGALVHTTWQESPVGPPRKYYALTVQGRAAYADLHDAWRAVRAAVDTLVKENR